MLRLEQEYFSDIEDSVEMTLLTPFFKKNHIKTNPIKKAGDPGSAVGSPTDLERGRSLSRKGQRFG
jgi:hypothetical protein